MVDSPPTTSLFRPPGLAQAASEVNEQYVESANSRQQDVLEIWEVTTRGRAYRTGTIKRLKKDWNITPSDLRTALTWDGGPVGIAECFYPHPKGWRLTTDPPGATLEKMTVRRLTAHYRQAKERAPTSLKEWARRYPWRTYTTDSRTRY